MKPSPMLVVATLALALVQLGVPGLNLPIPLTIPFGGTGETTATPAFDALAPTTTQGDVIYHNGTDNVRLGVGTNGQFLQTQGAGANPAFAWSPMSISVFGYAAVWTNQPAADTELFGAASDTQYAVADLTGREQARISLYRYGTVATGADCKAKYNTDGDVHGGTWTNLTSTELVINGAAGAKTQTTWDAIPAGGKAEVWLTVFCKDGDGVQDPGFSTVIIEVR